MVRLRRAYDESDPPRRGGEIIDERDFEIQERLQNSVRVPLEFDMNDMSTRDFDRIGRARREILDARKLNDIYARWATQPEMDDTSPLWGSVPFHTPGLGHKTRCAAASAGGRFDSDLTDNQREHLALLRQQWYDSLRGHRGRVDLFRYFKPKGDFKYKVMIGASRGLLVLTPDFELSSDTPTGSNLNPELRASFQSGGRINVHTSLDGTFNSVGTTENTLHSVISITLSTPKKKSTSISRFEIRVRDLLQEMEQYLSTVRSHPSYQCVHGLTRHTDVKSLLSQIIIYIRESNTFVSLCDLSDADVFERIRQGIMETTAWLSTVSGDLPEIRNYLSPYRAYSQFICEPIYVWDQFGVHKIPVRLASSEKFEVYRDDYDKDFTEGFKKLLKGDKTVPIIQFDTATDSNRLIGILATDLNELKEVIRNREFVVRSEDANALLKKLSDKQVTIAQLEEEIDKLTREKLKQEGNLLTKEADIISLNNRIKLLESNARERLYEEKLKQEYAKTAREQLKNESTEESNRQAAIIETLKLVGVVVTTAVTVTLAVMKASKK